MTEHRSTDGDSGDKSFAGRSRAWAELEVEMMEKYGHIPLEQFKTIVSHEMLLKCEEDALLKRALESNFSTQEFSQHIIEGRRLSLDVSLDNKAEERAKHLWNQCQPKPSVAESVTESVEELKEEIEKLRDEVNKLSTNKSINAPTNNGLGGCIWLVFLIVIVLLLIRWILL